MEKNASFCDPSILEEIISNFNKHLLVSSDLDLNRIYSFWKDNFQSQDKLELPLVNFNETSFYNFLDQQVNYNNMGIDLPVWFGDYKSSEAIMIVAMDPKRNSGEKNKISLNSVFSLHDSENGRDTKINDYWKFIQPLTENNFVYVTDAYKVYYEKTEGGKKIISNKDHNFKGKKTDSLLIHRKILQQEISLVKPKKIIAIGNEAIAAVKLILDVQSDQSIVEKNDVYYVFMPHTVRTVTNQVSSMGRLFECIRHIKDDEELENIGKTILANQNKLFLKKNSHE